MIFYNMDLTPDLPKDTDRVRGWLSRYSDAELIAQYSFCKHIDDFNFRFDEPDTEYPFVFLSLIIPFSSVNKWQCVILESKFLRRFYNGLQV